LIYIAKRPCGRVSALFWDDKGSEAETRKSIDRWIKRGDSVALIDVDALEKLEPICKQGCGDCR